MLTLIVFVLDLVGLSQMALVGDLGGDQEADRAGLQQLRQLA